MMEENENLQQETKEERIEEDSLQIFVKQVSYNFNYDFEFVRYVSFSF